MTTRRFPLIAAVIFLVACCPRAGFAGLIIDVIESGDDVVVSAEGQLNLNDLTLFGSSGTPAALQADRAILRAGVLQTVTDRYFIPVGPTTFGSGGGVLPDGGFGDRVGVFGDASGVGGTTSLLYVPTGYVSGEMLFGSSLYETQSFASLGLVEGSYVYSWGSAENAETLTINIGPSPVPEPSSLALIGSGATGLIALRRRRQSATSV